MSDPEHKRPKSEEVMLILSAEEHEYLLKLLLDYGSYVPPDRIRLPLVRKMARPFEIEDIALGSGLGPDRSGQSGDGSPPATPEGGA